ncbi:unnamed protein product [Eruca vesicaria subsp. sativa]|uniref:DUF641 domain-containing protein n=1 Tax=Eruca vesicaria subsp. sativa TaxID=29727 RepID=A0ABC8K1E4_ERUVS|nr:unnamed protein product [Eruca vesicaria subsp. sativa]
MREVETSSPPQLSAMFQKLAMAVKAKTYEFFTEDDNFSLLDSSEDFITDQKVVVLKPDPKIKTFVTKLDTQMGLNLISSIFATLSSFEASYLQLQAAHAPFAEETVTAADRALVSNLRKLSDLKHFYRTHLESFDLDADFAVGSCLESRVQENQSKLRALGTVSNRLQGEIDGKDSKVLELRKRLSEIQKLNSKLSRRLSEFESGVVLSVGVFESMLCDVVKDVKRFSKVLIGLMEKAGWDLGLAASYVSPEVEFVKKGHNRYALLSYVCLGMFRGFDDDEDDDDDSLMQHVSSNPMEILERDKECGFSRFCDKKYHELIHPNMESSIFSNMDQTEAVLSSWRSLSSFYESFVTMASSVWILRKLALSFDPAVEIFQVESGVDFSVVYMENVLRRRRDKKFGMNLGREKVGFTVVPGFKVGCTVIQSQVYLTGFKCK